MIIKTGKKDEIIDITKHVQEFISGQEKDSGICNIFVKHTTCAVTTADLDPGTDLDTLDFLRKIVPGVNFRHPHDPGHAPDHILSSIIGPSVSVSFKNKGLILGSWQKIILIELSGPREREIEITVV
jgi:secondary thiamine-phosphate synthase enzyme